MLSYWILRDLRDTPIGLVRTDGDRVLLTTTVPMTYRLFSDGADAPVVPCEETCFAGAAALLGVKEGELQAFALSPAAQSLDVYRKRLSQIYTNEAQPQPPNPAPIPPDPPPQPKAPAEDTSAPEEETPAQAQAFSDISDTARETEAFSLQLRRAEAFFARFEQMHPPAVDNLVQKEDNSTRAPMGVDPFGQLFPGARWRYVDGKDMLAHYEGEYRTPGGERMRILAVRGKYAPRPPRTLAGFTRFVRAPDGTGYWLRFLPER